MRFGTMLSMPGDPSGVRTITERAQAAEAAGFHSAWIPQVGSVDALMTLAIAGGATSRIELGTSVVPTYPRHPTVMAMQALTAQDASGGRIALGIGLSHKMSIEGALGLDYSKPIPHTREYLTVLNGLLSGERVDFEGELYRVHSQVTLKAPKPPVLVAALGPDMLRLCGRLADGTVTWMGGINYLRDVAIPTMTEAAAKAGRSSPRFVAMVPVVLSNDREAAREVVNKTYQVYGQIPSYRATLDRGGAALPADVGVLGTEEEIETGMRAFRDAGVTDFVSVIPRVPAGNFDATFEFLAELAKQSS